MPEGETTVVIGGMDVLADTARILQEHAWVFDASQPILPFRPVWHLAEDSELKLHDDWQYSILPPDVAGHRYVVSQSKVRLNALFLAKLLPPVLRQWMREVRVVTKSLAESRPNEAPRLMRALHRAAVFAQVVDGLGVWKQPRPAYVLKWVNGTELADSNWAYENIGYQHLKYLHKRDVKEIQNVLGEPVEHGDIKKIFQSLYRDATLRYLAATSKVCEPEEVSPMRLPALRDAFREMISRTLRYEYEGYLLAIQRRDIQQRESEDVLEDRASWRTNHSLAEALVMCEVLSEPGEPDATLRTLISRPQPLPGRGFLAGDGSYRMRMAGAYHRRASIASIAKNPPGVPAFLSCTAYLVCEPSNAHDPYAVRVEIAGLHVGYLPAADARRFTEAGACSSKVGCRALISAGLVSEEKDYEYIVEMDLAWPPIHSAPPPSTDTFLVIDPPPLIVHGPPGQPGTIVRTCSWLHYHAIDNLHRRLQTTAWTTPDWDEVNYYVQNEKSLGLGHKLVAIPKAIDVHLFGNNPPDLRVSRIEGRLAYIEFQVVTPATKSAYPTSKKLGGPAA